MPTNESSEVYLIFGDFNMSLFKLKTPVLSALPQNIPSLNNQCCIATKFPLSIAPLTYSKATE